MHVQCFVPTREQHALRGARPIDVFCILRQRLRFELLELIRALGAQPLRAFFHDGQGRP